MRDCPKCGSPYRECTCPEVEQAHECSIPSPHRAFFDCDCEICRPSKKLKKPKREH